VGLVAEDPLKVVQERPVHVAEYRHSRGHRVSQMRQGSRNEADALRVVVGAEPMFGDENWPAGLLVYVTHRVSQ
jgi:hypothetical protein